MAEEKKLSKTAQAREDAKNRRHFKEKCYEILMTKMLWDITIMTGEL